VDRREGDRADDFPSTRAGRFGSPTPAEGAVLRGAPLTEKDAVVGRSTWAERSIAVERAIGLGWIRSTDQWFPTELRAGSRIARVVPTPFYDPEGERVRG
jgi:glycine cleavage system aminomethyltransferase T